MCESTLKEKIDALNNVWASTERIMILAEVGEGTAKTIKREFKKKYPYAPGQKHPSMSQFLKFINFDEKRVRDLYRQQLLNGN